MYKNIEKQTKLKLKDQVEYQSGQVVSKTLVQNAAGSFILKYFGYTFLGFIYAPKIAGPMGISWI